MYSTGPAEYLKYSPSHLLSSFFPHAHFSSNLSITLLCSVAENQHVHTLIQLKGPPSKKATSHENTESVQVFPSTDFVRLSYQYLCNFLHFKFDLRGTAMLVCSLPMKSRKRLAHDITDACIALASLVHDVTYRLPDTERQHSPPSFCDFHTSIFNKLQCKLAKKML